MKDKDFLGIDHGKDEIDLSHLTHPIQMLPIEIHHKADGTHNDKPSFAIVLRVGYSLHTPMVYGQISLEMFNEGLADIGYKIIKIDEKAS